MNMAENYANDLISKELKKLMYSFNTVSSRMMRVSYEEYNPEEDFKLVSRDDSDEEYVFNFGPSSEIESYQIYEILKYILENVPNPVYSFYSFMDIAIGKIM